MSIALRDRFTTDYNYNEAVRTLRTNLQFCGENIKTIMMTSAVPDEGKTDTTLALGYSLVQMGKRVVVVDADIRKSVLATGFSHDPDFAGLSQYLIGQKAVTDIIVNTDIEGFDIIFAGPFAPNPAELFEGDYFSHLLSALRTMYDYVLIDTPPVGSAVDAVIISKKCDGVILVIESGTISYKYEQKIKQKLDASGCRILGAVLNKFDNASDGFYGKGRKNGRKTGKFGHKYGKYASYSKMDKYGALYEEYRNGEKAINIAAQTGGAEAAAQKEAQLMNEIRAQYDDTTVLGSVKKAEEIKKSRVTLDPSISGRVSPQVPERPAKVEKTIIVDKSVFDDEPAPKKAKKEPVKKETVSRSAVNVQIDKSMLKNDAPAETKKVTKRTTVKTQKKA